MTTKELLLQKIDLMTETQLAEMLTLVEKIKTESNPEGQQSKPPHHIGSGNILRHAGKWVGDDLKECLKMVYDSRGNAQF